MGAQGDGSEMNDSRRALIQKIRDWAAREGELLFVAVLNCKSIALFKDQVDAAATDEDLSQLIDERLAAPRTTPSI
jgi:hypothetical protein